MRWRPRLHTSFHSPNLQHSPRPPPSTPTQRPASPTLFQPGHLYCIRTLSRSSWQCAGYYCDTCTGFTSSGHNRSTSLCPLLGFLHPLLLQSLKASLAVGGTQTLSDSLSNVSTPQTGCLFVVRLQCCFAVIVFFLLLLNTEAATYSGGKKGKKSPNSYSSR